MKQHLKSLHQAQAKSEVSEACLLKRAVEKLVLYGQMVGVTPEEIISLLDSGISVRDLLAFVVSKGSGAA